MKNFKILITGGAGYIGSKLTTKLVHMNFKVTVLDNLTYSVNSLNHLFSYKNLNFIKGDVRNKRLLKSLVNNNDIIIPLAGLVGAPLCEKKRKYANAAGQLSDYYNIDAGFTSYTYIRGVSSSIVKNNITSTFSGLDNRVRKCLIIKNDRGSKLLYKLLYSGSKLLARNYLYIQ